MKTVNENDYRFDCMSGNALKESSKSGLYIEVLLFCRLSQMLV